MVKVKHHRTADCVVAGYRIHKDGKGVGSLLLGLYDDEGVSTTSAWRPRSRPSSERELLAELEPLTHNALDEHPWRDWADAEAHATGRMPGAPSRWNADEGPVVGAAPPRAGRRGDVRPAQSGRFRHGVTFLRWRPDRDARVVHLRPARRGRAGRPHGLIRMNTLCRFLVVGWWPLGG